MRFIHQLFIYIAVAWMIYLFINFQPIYLLYIAIGLLLIAQLSAYYHRCLSHRQWHCPDWLQHILLYINASFLAGHAAVWMAIHVQHHQHSDTEKDPHGPKAGLWTTMNNSYYKFSPKHVGVFLKRSRPVALQFKYYYAAPIITAGLLSLIDIAIWPIITSFLWIAVVATNYICHFGDKPRDFGSLSLITGGDSYHKSHHETHNIRFGKWDTGYFLLNLLAKLGSPKTKKC